MDQVILFCLNETINPFKTPFIHIAGLYEFLLGIWIYTSEMHRPTTDWYPDRHTTKGAAWKLAESIHAASENERKWYDTCVSLMLQANQRSRAPDCCPCVSNWKTKHELTSNKHFAMFTAISRMRIRPLYGRNRQLLPKHVQIMHKNLEVARRQYLQIRWIKYWKRNIQQNSLTIHN